MGSGFKDFGAEVLTSNDVDGYLMRQTVMTFASDSARDSALSGVLTEGLFAYTTDNNRLYFYTGSAWEIISEPPQTWSVSSVTQSGSVACSTTSGWYTRSRGVVRANLLLSFSGTGTAGNPIVVAAPITLSGACFGHGHFFDTSTAIMYGLELRSNTATTLNFHRDGESQFFGQAPSIAIASGDGLVIDLVGRY